MVGRILIFVGAVIVVALFAALLAPVFIDWTGFRKDFEDQASRIIGKKVTVHGAVDARLLPFPSVTMHDVRVGTQEDGQPVVTVEQFSMDAELAPFLSGEALIFDMRIVNPKMTLRLLKDGTLDWMRGSQPEIPAKTVVLEHVKVTGGDIAFIDNQSGRNRHISGLNADMSAKSLAGPWRIEGDASLDGHHGNFLLSSSQPDDSGVLRLRTRLQPDQNPVTLDLDGELKLVSSRPNYQGTFAATMDNRGEAKSADKNEQLPRAKGRFELTNESIRLPEYRLEVDKLDDPYVVTGEATLDTGTNSQFLLTANGQQIDVNRIGNQGASGKTSRDPTLSARQRLNSLVQIVSQIPIPQVPGTATVRLPAIVAGDTTIRDVRLDLAPAGNGWKIDNAVGMLPGRTEVEGKGLLMLRGAPSFNGQITVASNQPTALANWLSGSVDPAIRPLRQAGFTADVSLTHERQRFDNLEIAIGPASLKGSLERNVPANQTPTLDVALSGDALDLDALKALTGLFTGQDAGDNVLDHKIHAQFKAGKLSVAGVEAGDVETSFTIADGALSIERLSVKNFAGAEITGTGRAEGSLLDYRGSGEFTFKSADPGPFLAMLQQHLPHHPVMDRLERNSAWYANTALRGALTLGANDGDGLTVTLAGVANGSRVNLDYRMSDLLAFDGKGTTTLEATLENATTSILFGQAGLDPLPINADSNGRLTLKVQADGSNPADAALTFATDKTSFTATGKVDVRPESFLNGELNLALESGDIGPYLLMNGIAVPQTGAGTPFKLQTKASVFADKIALEDLKGQAADNGFSGVLGVNRKSDRASITGNLALAKTDAAWLAEAVYGPLTDPSNGTLSANPLAKPTFRDLDVALKLSVGQFWAGWPQPITGFGADLVYRGDELQLRNIGGEWDGGRLSGNVLFSNADGTGILQTKLSLADADLGGMVWTRDGSPLATGKFGLSLASETSGKSATEMAAALSGTGQFDLGKTNIRGMNLSILPPLIAATDPMQDQINAGRIHPIVETLLNNGEAELPPATIPFNLSGGIMRVQNVAAENDLATVNGEAQIDLVKKRLNATIGIVLKASNDALPGAQPAIKLNFSGLLASPGRTIDVTDLTGYLSLRAFERERRRVERLQSNLQEKQRLRREVALYRFNDAERQKKAAEIEALRKAEEERLRALAEEAAKQKADADAAAKAKAAADEVRRAQQQAPASPPATPPLNLRFDRAPGMPGVEMPQ
ncbi:AsmA family protein [Oryzifoliimicrobium ureilyticus]|uniref:AsmA family protein n=1 Tax=Oryzifoliimicrobium ureilyticus TaxID=3113724 RepID=UPI0030764D79